MLKQVANWVALLVARTVWRSAVQMAERRVAMKAGCLVAVMDEYWVV